MFCWNTTFGSYNFFYQRYYQCPSIFPFLVRYFSPSTKLHVSLMGRDSSDFFRKNWTVIWSLGKAVSSVSSYMSEIHVPCPGIGNTNTLMPHMEHCVSAKGKWSQIGHKPSQNKITLKQNEPRILKYYKSNLQYFFWK